MVTMILTADCHLKKSEAERIDVFRWICKQCARNQADALLIGGDLFDSPADATALVSDVKLILREELPPSTAVVMVPGNHDENLGNLGWPSFVRVLDYFETFELSRNSETVRIHGLPYMRGESLGDDAREVEFREESTDMLLGHASYLTPDNRYLLDKIEDQNEENSFVVFDEDLRGSEYERVFLGHWHGYQEMGGDPMVTYVGSPLPNSRNERGTKNIMAVEVNGGVLTYTPEDVECPPGWYYEDCELFVVPSFEDDVLEELEGTLSQSNPGCRLRVIFEGFTGEDAEALKRDVESRLDKFETDNRRYQLKFDVTEADQFDSPVISRLLEQLRSSEPTDFLSASDVVHERESDRVYSLVDSALSEQAEEIKTRAQRFAVRALYRKLTQ